MNRLDLLNTFEVLCADPVFARKIAEGQEVEKIFDEFANQDLLKFALRMAQEGHFHTLEILFTRHGKRILPFRLSLLEQLPVLLPPQTYKNLLPKIAHSKSTEDLWTEIPWRRSDWTADPALEELVSLVKNTPIDNYNLVEFDYPTTHVEITEWYKKRISFLESPVGISSAALEFAILGKENGVKGLESVISRLSLSCYAIYDIPDNFITIDDLLLLPVNEAMSFFIPNQPDPDSICQKITNLVIPFLNLRSSAKSGDGEVDLSPLYSSLQTRSLTCDSFQWLENIVVNSMLNIKRELRVIPSFSKLTQLCIESAYCSDKIPDVKLWLRIVNCLTYSDVSVVYNPPSELNDFHEATDVKKIDTLRSHLLSARILGEHGQSATLKFIKKCSNDLQEQLQLVNRFPRKSKLLAESMNSDYSWSLTLRDFLDMHENGKILGNVAARDIYASVASFALCEARFKFVKSMLFPEKSFPVLPLDLIENVVIESAREFIDNSKDCDKNSGFLKQALSW